MIRIQIRLSAVILLMTVALCLSASALCGTAYARSSAKSEEEERLIKVKEDHVRAGYIYYKIKLYDKAINQWEKALKLDPKDKKTASMLESAKKQLEVGSRAMEARDDAAKLLKKLEAEKKRLAQAEEEKKRAELSLKEKASAQKPEEAKGEQPKAGEKEVSQGEKKEEVKAPEAAEGKAQPSAPVSEAEKKRPEEPVKGKVKEEAGVEAAKEKEAEAPPAEIRVPPAPQFKKHLVPPTEVPGGAAGKEPITVNGDKVEYFHEEKRVIGTGNISITYRDAVLTCDKVAVNLETREAVAEGNVRVTQKNAYFTGEKISYNFDTRQGKVINGDLTAKPFYGKAQEVTKPANKDQFSMQRGYATTCDFEKPHYRVQAREVKIYPNDKVIARHILLFLGNVPVLYLPYYVQPLNNMKTSLAVTGGKKSDWGYYVLTALRYHLNEQNQGDFLLDYRAKRGLGVGVNHYYDTKEIGKGAGKFYYTNDYADYMRFIYDPDTDRPGDRRVRYRWQWRHRWDFGENNDTTATIEFNKLSDRDIIKDFFYTEYEELGDKPDSYVSVITQKENYTSQLLARKRFSKFLDVVERLPEYTLSIPNQNIIPGTRFYYTGSLDAVYLNHTFDNSNTSTTTSGNKDVSTARVDNYNKLSYAARFFGSLSITPYFSLQETYYSRNMWGDTNLDRTAFGYGVDTSIKFYKIYDVKTNFLNLDINKIRHVITPTISYNHIEHPTVSWTNLNQFDSIDSLQHFNTATFSLENKLQTKRLQDGQLTSVDLFDFIVSTPYSFRLKDNNLGLKEHYNKFDRVDLQMEIIPYSWCYAVSKAMITPKNAALGTESIDFVVHDEDRWSLGAGHRYEKSTTDQHSNFLTTDFAYKINEKWSIRAYDRFNLDKSFEEQQYTIYRELHCWRAEFTYSIRKNPNEINAWVIFTLKAFPNYPIGYKRSYSTPRFGEAGAGQSGYDAGNRMVL